MKKFVLPGLVIVGVVAVTLGVWWLKGREERIGVERDSRIENEKLKIENDQASSVARLPSWAQRYLKPGVQYRLDKLGHEQVSLVNGEFVRWQRINGSKDKYLVLQAEGQEIPLLRVVFTPRDDLVPTQVGLFFPQKASAGANDFGRLVSDDISTLDTETFNSLFTAQSWVSALVWRDELGKSRQDEAGAYIVRTLMVKGSE